MRKLLLEITIPEYITKVKLSEKRQAKYYNVKGKKKIPDKYLKDKKRYLIDGGGFIRDKFTGNKVIANSRSVGTPKYSKINGQAFYSGFGSFAVRMAIVAGIKNFFKPFLRGIPPITEYPVQFEMELHAPIEEGNWDLDNLWIYTKCFQDMLTDMKILVDDNIQFVTKPAAPEFFPVKTMEERKIVFKIYKDDRNIQITEPVHAHKTNTTRL